MTQCETSLLALKLDSPFPHEWVRWDSFSSSDEERIRGNPLDFSSQLESFHSLSHFYFSQSSPEWPGSSSPCSIEISTRTNAWIWIVLLTVRLPWQGQGQGNLEKTSLSYFSPPPSRLKTTVALQGWRSPYLCCDKWANGPCNHSLWASTSWC